MLRTIPERILQTLCFEMGGLIIAVPIFSYFTQTNNSDSLYILIAISIVVMCWSAIHNFIFDWVEFQHTARVASDRPNNMRIVHAISHEATAIVVSLPTLLSLTELTWKEAIVANIGLTLLYTAYAFIFYRLYDAIRPVQVTNMHGV